MGSSLKFLMLLSSPFPRLYPFPSAFRFARHSRIPLATSSSIQNRIFTSNLSPKLNFTVKASEQIHSQTSNVREGYYNGEPLGFSSNSRASHPWPEWSKLVENLRAGGYFNNQTSSPVSMDGDDAFSVFENLPEEFVQAANACLLFARDRSDILGSLSRKDIEVVVENGTPFLFKNALDSGRLMRSFLVSSGSNVLEHERAHTVDLMRFLLSYACNPLVASDSNNLNNRELVDSSVRNLLNELADVSRATQVEDFSRSMPKQFPDRYGQTPRPFGQNIEMKRGDWICTKCNFMNFARNMKCLECDEARPRKQVTGGEWECPQCDFFNYGRNMVCLRCDCKRPGQASLTGSPGPGLGYSYVSNSTKADNESRIATNDEKAERWFSKVSQLDNASDISNAAADEDFPEIMPLRKGVNRFVVSTRKTPLERRLANAQYRRNLGNDGTLEENDAQSTDSSGDTSISGSLDRILGHASPNSEPESGSATPRERIIGVKANNSIPFVPLPADMFGNPQKSNAEDKSGNSTNSLSRSSETDKSGDGLFLSGKPESKTNSVDDKEQAEKSERWFKKVAELHDVTDLASAISDEDFPEIMPMRKGENRFVVSKKKDRSLTSPLYKRRMAMEQSSNTNFVPFVPFPPDYFSKKDKQPDSEPSNETSVNAPEKYSGELGQGTSIENQNNPRTNTSENYNSGSSWKENTNKENTNSAMGSPLEQSENPRKVGFSGKSLEGSAVKEPDPLDMSEEAKAERWFRRVAQIKDISELANIPDEDFPQIMPMRKGVNRFVVSKRKTPLERRLTSPQYRRNLPIVTSDPAKKENDTS